MTPIPTVGVLVIKGNKVLLVRHESGASHVTGVYGWPGGRIDPGETLKQAAVREFAEETGLVTTEERLHPVTHHLAPVIIPRKNGEKQTFSVELFTCSQYSGTLRGSAETTPEWVEVKELGNLPLLPNVEVIVGILIKDMIQNTKISIIVAVDEKGGIGKDNDLLFKIKDDMKRLRALTSGHPLVMGRKTFDSFPGLLPNRTHIVVTRNPKAYENAAVKPHHVVRSLEEGIAVAKKSEGSGEIFIFGGGQIFKEAIEKDLVDRLYLTIVKGDYHADTFFPSYSPFIKLIEREDKVEDDYHYSFLTLEK